MSRDRLSTALCPGHPRLMSSGCWAEQAGASWDLNLQASRDGGGAAASMLQLNGDLDQSTE